MEQPASSIVIKKTKTETVLTTEHLLYALALLVALGLRLVGLGEAPLAPLEAAQAWPAFLSATGTQVTSAPAPLSALYYGLQSWLFWAVGSGDAAARLLPALAGVSLVLLPWWWRSWLGRSGALVVASLLAIDPWLVALSRTGDSAMLSISLGLLTLTALWYFFSGLRSAGRLVAVSLALLLVSGPLAWSWLPILALFAWFVRTRARPATHSLTVGALIWFAAALLLGASGFLAWPNAFAAVGASLSAWLNQWSNAADSGLGIGWPFVRLFVDQPLLLIFGPIGLIMLAVSISPRTLSFFLTLWAGWGLLLLLLPGRSAFVLPMLGLPLLIAAGVAIAALLELSLDDVGGLELTLLLAVASVLLIAGGVWLALAVESASYDTRLALTAVALVGLTVAIWLVFGFWAGWKVAGKVAGLFFAVVLLLVGVRSTTFLTQPGGRMTPAGLFAVTTLPEARLLAQDVQRISSIRFGDPFEAPVQVVRGGEDPDPLVGWLLRKMVNLSWATAPDMTAVSTVADGSSRVPLIVTPAGMEQDRGLGGMIGADYPLTMHWEPSMLPSMPAMDDAGAGGLPPEELARLRSEQAWSQATRPQLEWLLYRKIRTEPTVNSVTLWAMP